MGAKFHQALCQRPLLPACFHRHQPPDFKDALPAMPLTSLSSHSALYSDLALITHSELSPNGLCTSPTCLSVTSLFSLSSFLDQLFTLHHTSSSSWVFPSSPLTGHGVCIQSPSSDLLTHQELSRMKPVPPSGSLRIPWLAWTPSSPLKKGDKGAHSVLTPNSDFQTSVDASWLVSLSYSSTLKSVICCLRWTCLQLYSDYIALISKLWLKLGAFFTAQLYITHSLECILFIFLFPL